MRGWRSIKHTTFGSFEEVRKINACPHTTKRRIQGILFGYLKVVAQCEDCRTFFAPTGKSSTERSGSTLRLTVSDPAT